MVYRYKTQGVCSQVIDLDVDEEGIVRDIEFHGGCDGNLKGVCKLSKGRTAKEVADLLEGIPCANKPTSCPDQLAKALKLILEKDGKQD